jgi:AcrR family transcriptional regulator
MSTEEDTTVWGLDPATRKPLPRGRHALSRETVIASQRGRMLHAVLVATARKGFGYVVIGDIIAEAGVSRKAFYEHFADFEDCWFQAYETAQALLFEHMVAAGADAAGGDPLVALKAAIAVLTQAAADEPEVSHATAVDVIGGGPEGLKAHQETLHRWANLLLLTWDHKSASESSEQRRFAAMAAVSVVTGTIRDHLVAGTAEQLPGLSDQVSEMMATVLSK